mmetsp:Transcript_19048/g.57549  ORF Transcript_19048/g.57549 Transcript_19048/m.57549 type:complete len:99 (-) Transcript_19048:368-664(-)
MVRSVGRINTFWLLRRPIDGGPLPISLKERRRQVDASPFVDGHARERTCRRLSEPTRAGHTAHDPTSKTTPLDELKVPFIHRLGGLSDGYVPILAEPK